MTVKQDLVCSQCGRLVADVRLTGGELRAYLMRWRYAHAARCDGKVALQERQNDDAPDRAAAWGRLGSAVLGIGEVID